MYPHVIPKEYDFFKPQNILNMQNILIVLFYTMNRDYILFEAYKKFKKDSKAP